MEEKISELEIKQNKSKSSWFIADGWFRILEFSFIIGLIYHFKEKTGSVTLSIAYWLSWVLFWGWFLDAGNFIAEFLITEKRITKRNKFAVKVLSIIIMGAIFIIVISVANSLTFEQFK